MGAGRQALLAGLAWTALAIAPAAAADMSSLGIDNSMPPPAPVIAPGPTTYINFLDEARVGVYAHNWIHDEGAPVDVSGELLSNPIGYANNIGGPWFSWFFNPRINIGAMINTEGKTSYGFTGLTWRIPIYKGFFFEGEFGAAVNTSTLRDEPDRVNTGCRWDFREVRRLRLPVRRALGCYRQYRAHLARQPLHPHQPRPDPGRRADRV